jgi:hypothetical protein
MSSWARAQPRATSTLRLGYYQALPEGRFTAKEKPATVVSAYYEMKSKYSVETYRAWIRDFLEQVPCHLVFFTEAATAPFIEDCRRAWPERTRVIVLPRTEWAAATRFPAGFWQAQHGMDPEKGIHSPELYQVWYEKKEFVRRAIELNPFDHDDFVWTDAGAIRNPDLLAILRDRYPVAARIPTDRMLLLNYWPYVAADDIAHSFGGVSMLGGIDKPRIGGGILAANRATWDWWNHVYDETVERYRRAGLFIGKDQTLMSTIVLENRGRVSLLDLRKIAPEPWFYLLWWLGCSDKLYALCRSGAAQKEKWTYARLRAFSESS